MSDTAGQRLLRAGLYGLFRVAERSGAPLTAASRAGEERGDPRPELRSQAYDVAHAIRCWRARRAHLAPGALDAVAAAELSGTVDPEVGPAEALASVLPGGWHPGNEVSLSADNAADFERRLALIAGARHTVACAFWCIRADETGRRFVAALAERVRGGIDVLLVLDANILDRFAWIDPSYADFIREIEASGVRFVRLRPPHAWLNTHRKVFVVDGAVALVGGRNIGLPYATPGPGTFRDTDLEVRGPAALAAHRLLETLAGAEPATLPDPPAEGSDRVAVVDQPARLDPVDDTMVRGLVNAVRHARTSVDLAFGYLILPLSLERALVEAAERGVAVRVLTNSRVTNDYPYWEGAAFASLDGVVRAGVPVYRMKSQTLHAKFGVIDRRVATVGSHNLWTLSTLHDAETNLFVDSERVGAALTAEFEGLLADADRADPATWEVPESRALALANTLIWAWTGRS